MFSALRVSRARVRTRFWIFCEKPLTFLGESNMLLPLIFFLGSKQGIGAFK